MDSSRELLARLKTVGPIGVLISALLVGVLVSVIVRDIVLTGAARVVAAGTSGVAAPHVVKGVDGYSVDTPALDGQVKPRLAARQIVSYRLYDPDGRVMYSDQSDTVGTTVSPDRDFRRALEGGTPYRIEDTPPHLRAEGVSSQVLVVRAGVKGPKSGSVVGVVETARDYAGVSMSVRDSLLLIWIVVGLGAAVMAGILRYVAWSTEAELVRGGRRVASLNARLDIALGDLEDQSLGVLQALCEAVDAKDSYTAHHSLGVADIASRLGGQLGMTEGELAVVERAALLHDIGKIGVPEELLLKPTALEPDEFERVKEHSETGARIIGTLPFLTQVVPVVRHHHEHWDGTGYPLGLTGDDIPFAARILAVADAFDAMTTDRPYRKAIAATAALAEIRRCSGSQFDPEVVSAIGVMAEAGGLIARGDERGGE